MYQVLCLSITSVNAASYVLQLTKAHVLFLAKASSCSKQSEILRILPKERMKIRIIFQPFSKLGYSWFELKNG
jgi:hypothetical protein